MFDFAQSIRDRRPKLRDTSVSAYATSLKTLAPEGGENIQDLSFLKDTKQVLSNASSRSGSRWSSSSPTCNDTSGSGS